MPKKSCDVQVRWLIRRDMPEVLAIEKESFVIPWCDGDFLSCLRQRNCIGMVAEHNHQIVGFMLYELHKSRLNVLNFAVAPEWRRRGVGRQMTERLRDKLSQQRRTEIRVQIREGNFIGQAFFREQGFLCHGVIRGEYLDTGEDAYQFRFAVDGSEVPFIVREANPEKQAAYSDGYPKDDDEDGCGV